MRIFLRLLYLYLLLALSPTVVWGDRPSGGDDEPVRAKRPFFRSENVAIVGLLDIDRDGRSDREWVHKMLRASKSRIEEEIDEHGKRTGPGITAKTHCLLVGNIPDPNKLEGKEREAAIRRENEAREMVVKARKLGVRVVWLSELLTYGSCNRPGLEERLFPRPPVPADRWSSLQDRSSSGQVSRRFTNRHGLRFERGIQDGE